MVGGRNEHSIFEDIYANYNKEIIATINEARLLCRERLRQSLIVRLKNCSKSLMQSEIA